LKWQVVESKSETDLNRVLEYWSTGVLEHWSTGVLEYWSIGVLGSGLLAPDGADVTGVSANVHVHTTTLHLIDPGAGAVTSMLSFVPRPDGSRVDAI
jgi:hypothetical protein